MCLCGSEPDCGSARVCVAVDECRHCWIAMGWKRKSGGHSNWGGGGGGKREGGREGKKEGRRDLKLSRGMRMIKEGGREDRIGNKKSSTQHDIIGGTMGESTAGEDDLFRERSLQNRCSTKEVGSTHFNSVFISYKSVFNQKINEWSQIHTHSRVCANILSKALHWLQFTACILSLTPLESFPALTWIHTLIP